VQGATTATAPPPPLPSSPPRSPTPYLTRQVCLVLCGRAAAVAGSATLRFVQTSLRSSGGGLVGGVSLGGDGEGGGESSYMMDGEPSPLPLPLTLTPHPSPSPSPSPSRLSHSDLSHSDPFPQTLFTPLPSHPSLHISPFTHLSSHLVTSFYTPPFTPLPSQVRARYARTTWCGCVASAARFVASMRAQTGPPSLTSPSTALSTARLRALQPTGNRKARDSPFLPFSLTLTLTL
jgi:hypothetical protein